MTSTWGLWTARLLHYSKFYTCCCVHPIYIDLAEAKKKGLSNQAGFGYSHGHQFLQTSPFNANAAPAMSCKSFCNFSENRVHIIWKGRLAISRTSIPAIRKDQETFLDRIRILRSPGKRLHPPKVILSLSAFLTLSPEV